MRSFALPSRRSVLVLASLFLSNLLFSAPPFESLIGDETHWAATRWSPAEVERFGGMPKFKGLDPKLIILRYSYYVSNYDLEHRVPLWVAHIDGKDSELKAKGRTGKGTRWDRQGDGFTTDPNVRWAAGHATLRFVTNDSYKNANPPDFPETPDTKITRGHMASNLEMKSQGNEDEGDQSQSESFSLANACPQMQAHNNPIWAKLEDQCMVWARTKSGVAVISGPIFAPIAGQPLPIGKQLGTDGGKDGVKIPIPTDFFKVVIAETNGRRSAIGFIVPHRNDLFIKTLRDRGLAACIVPIREIERLTGIDFMPLLGTNNRLELAVPTDWKF